MKTMKKLLSVLLLVCLLASVMPAAAYATASPSPAVSPSPAASPSPTVPAGPAVPATAVTVTPETAGALEIGKTVKLSASPTPADASDITYSWYVQGNSGVVSVTKDQYPAVVTALSAGTATVVCEVYQKNGAGQNVYACSGTYTVTVQQPAPATPAAVPTTVTVTSPANGARVPIGESVELVASVSGSSAFSHWLVEGYGDSCTVNSSTSDHAILTALKSYNSSVTITAIAKDNTKSQPITIYIDPARTLTLKADKESVSNGESVNVYVENPAAGDSFNWTYSTTPAGVDVIKSATPSDTNMTLVAGKGDGYVTVTASSKKNAQLTASITLPVNAVGYGDASIAPTKVNWARGQGNLTFTVKPTLYAAYIDGVCFTGSGNTGKYSYVWSSQNLVINSSYLSTLSAGDHILKVDTRYDNGDPAGVVYATITVSGTASAVYGDNAHVRGNGNNLYFTSTSPISRVYISNQLIDPANYTIGSDGRTLTLKANFLNLLNYGNYTMRLENAYGGTETTSFRIVTANYAPATGDESNLAIWVAVMIISGVGAIALIPRRKREM